MRIKITAALTLCLCLAGCTSFERSTFQTLSASKAVLDQAQTDYEAGTPIPHNQCAYALINDGKAAQTVAVDAMLVYEGEKAAGKDLTSQTTVITADLLSLAPIVVKVQSLIVNPASCAGVK